MLQNKMNTFLHQPQPQVRELTLDDNFLTTARNYFWPMTNSKEDDMLLFPQSLRGNRKHKSFGYGNTQNTEIP